jgi:stage II sporulation protein P
MKKYSHEKSCRQLNRGQLGSSKNKKRKKRLFVLSLLICWLAFKPPVTGGEDWKFQLINQVLPLLTYEQQYGNSEVSYEASYQVPEWFYEDEGQSGGDDVMSQIQAEGGSLNETVQGEKGEDNTQEETITTLGDGNGGVSYTRQQLANPEFLLNKIFVVDSNTSMTSEELDISNLLDMDMTVENLKGEQYKILIYHTHGSESFADSREGVKEDTVIGVGSYLTKLLQEEYGIPVYHDETAYDVIDGVLDRSRAYENAYSNVSKILEENPSIQVVIDLHRDGVDDDLRLVTDINGKPTAKIMFLNGVSRSNTNGEIDYLKNPNKLANLAFSFQMYLKGKQYYGDYVRKIYVKSLRFNLHLLPRTSLIEVGAQNNTVEEEMNAMEPLAAILNEVLSDEQ